MESLHLGLFAWNEADDHWFDLRKELQEVGGSNRYDNSSIAGGWIVEVYGVTVSFQGWTDGVKGTASSYNIPYVRADVFYSKVVAAATEISFLTGHKAFGGWAFGNLHMVYFTFISCGSEYWDHDDFKNNVKWGNVRFATIGGTQIEGTKYLGGQFNRRTDIKFETKVYPMQHLHTGIGKLDEVYEAYKYFADNSSTKYKYNAIGDNSSTYLRGLLNAVGITPTIREGFWLRGWNRPLIPASDFGGKDE